MTDDLHVMYLSLFFPDLPKHPAQHSPDLLSSICLEALARPWSAHSLPPQSKCTSFTSCFSQELHQLLLQKCHLLRPNAKCFYCTLLHSLVTLMAKLISCRSLHTSLTPLDRETTSRSNTELFAHSKTT